MRLLLFTLPHLNPKFPFNLEPNIVFPVPGKYDDNDAVDNDEYAVDDYDDADDDDLGCCQWGGKEGPFGGKRSSDQTTLRK